MEIITTDHITDDLRWLYKRATEDPNNRLQENYQEIPEALLYSVAYVDGVPRGTNCVMERDCYNGMVRIGSRSYWDQKPGDTLVMPRPWTLEAHTQQMIILGDRDVFISRDDPTPRLWKRLHKGLQEKSIFNWQIDTENRYTVYPGCNQWVIWSGENRLCISHEDI